MHASRLLVLLSFTVGALSACGTAPTPAGPESPALLGQAEWPRKEFIYWTDDGSVAALRYENLAQSARDRRGHHRQPERRWLPDAGR